MADGVNRNDRDLEEDIFEVIAPKVQQVCRDYDIIAAYLYGSFARKEQRSDSDIDIAIYFRNHSLKKVLEVGRRIQEETDISRHFDVRALNNASPLFQFRVIQQAKVLYESSPEERADIEVEIDWRYHDLKPHMEEHWAERRKRVIESG